MKRSKLINVVLTIIFVAFVAISYMVDYNDGMKTGEAFLDVLIEMLKILPCAFILLGLFEVWVKKDTVMQHLGETCGIKGYLWILLLAGFSVGGLYVAFPVAQSLYRKGASLKIIFTYLGFAGIVRIPMTIFEITFLGLPFTFVRLMVTIPLFLLVGVVMGTVLKRRGYNLNKFRGAGAKE
jgi:uncharacterized membrane protein YraQ (UPF0718 family)